MRFFKWYLCNSFLGLIKLLASFLEKGLLVEQRAMLADDTRRRLYNLDMLGE